MTTRMFQCKEATSNKFWSYETKGTTVTCKWGRVGTDGQSKEFKFSSSYEVDTFVNDKVKEKKNKGYEEITKEILGKETALAESLGFRQKIDTLEFVSADKLSGNSVKLTELKEYDPEEYIFVKTMDSWDKISSQGAQYYLISKKHGHQRLSKPNGNKYDVSSLWDVKVADAILTYLNDQISKFTKIITSMFGSFAGRTLDDDVVAQAVSDYKHSSGADSNLSDKVLGKLASMSGFASFAGRVIDF